MSGEFKYRDLAHYYADALESVFEKVAELAPAVVSADNLVFDVENNCYKGTLVLRFGAEYNNDMLISTDELQEAADIINDETSNLLFYQDEMRSEMSDSFNLVDCWFIPDKYKHIRDKYFPEVKACAGCCCVCCTKDDESTVTYTDIPEPETDTRQ